MKVCLVCAILFMISLVKAQGSSYYRKSAEQDKKAQSNWILLAKYNDFMNERSEIKNGEGSDNSSVVRDQLGFLGLGINYQSNTGEGWSLTPEVTISQYIKNRSDFQYDSYIAMISTLVKYRERYLDIFFGPSLQQILPDYKTKKSPALGSRVGLSYYFDDNRSLVQIGVDFMTFHNEETAQQDYKINSKASSLAITYGYRI